MNNGIKLQFTSFHAVKNRSAPLFYGLIICLLHTNATKAEYDPTFNGMVDQITCDYIEEVECDDAKFCVPTIRSLAALFTAHYDMRNLSSWLNDPHTSYPLAVKYVSPGKLGAPLKIEFDVNYPEILSGKVEILLMPQNKGMARYIVNSGFVRNVDKDSNGVSYYGGCRVSPY